MRKYFVWFLLEFFVLVVLIFEILLLFNLFMSLRLSGKQ